MIKVGIIGSGYWGKHHLRIFSKIKCNLIGISDIDDSKKKLADQYRIAFYRDYKKLLKKIDAVSIVTPPETHYRIAKKALKAGKHVLLEKPFVLNHKQAQELFLLSQNKNLVLLPGHIYLYNNNINYIKNLIKQGSLGKIYYLLMQRMNLGIIRHDVNALWNFAPHDLSIVMDWFDDYPEKVSAFGSCLIQPGIEDFVSLTMTFPNQILVQIFLSWLHPKKVRQLSLVGSNKLIFFDDTNIERPLEIYHKGVTAEEFNLAKNWSDYSEFLAKKRFGNVDIPQIIQSEPLKEELQEFIRLIEQGKNSADKVANAIKVISLLEYAQKSLRKGGVPIETKKS